MKNRASFKKSKSFWITLLRRKWLLKPSLETEIKKNFFKLGKKLSRSDIFSGRKSFRKSYGPLVYETLICMNGSRLKTFEAKCQTSPGFSPHCICNDWRHVFGLPELIKNCRVLSSLYWQLVFSTLIKSLSGTKNFLTCKVKHRKLEVRNSSKDFFFWKNYHSPKIFFFFKIEKILFVFVSKLGFKSSANIFLILQAPLHGISTTFY